MPITADELERTMNEFAGGSDDRFRHALNRRFIYTSGVAKMAEAAEAFWFIDMVALQMAPLYAKAWKAGKTGIGTVKLEVYGSAPKPAPLTVGAVVAARSGSGSRVAAKASLSLADDEPDAFTEEVEFTDFPVGMWTFLLGTDEVGPDEYVTTMCLVQEY